ncbi:Clr5 domain-containing protein [Madurella fahalii]|uniref:Clr5 domain-containing protein n=1 Tax=Madurella fahalii TaxID=1157608 RepID=A0ABQ0FXG1_9PEZI
MVYNWDPHREVCYRLYVEEKRSLDEIVEYMREHYDFTPSRRSFQGTFSRWGFPNRLNPAYKNERLVARVRELWEQNLNQKEMLRILVDEEGFQIGERELARIRSKNGWLLRSSAGYGEPVASAAARRRRDVKSAVGDEDGEGEDDGSHNVEDENDDDEEEEGEDEEGNSTLQGHGADGLSPADAPVHNETYDAFRQAHREERKRRLAAENYEKWAAKKRRRHTKPYAGLPADPPGVPPRFPSETTLSEAKEILQLDVAAYKTVRDKFHAICLSAGVVKKTIAGPEKWEALKDQLVRESMHLRSVMWDPIDMDKKKLAIEIIACDVTKRIRTVNNSLSIAEAKSILGLNPEEGREVRASLYNILAEEKFTAKLEEGLDYFEALKQRWIAGSELLSNIANSEHTDPDYHRKMKAINMICRDATRRYRDDVFRLGKRPWDPKPVQEKQPKSKTKTTGQAHRQSSTSTNTVATQSTPGTTPGQTPARASVQTPEEAPSQMPVQSAPPRRRGRPPGSKNKNKPLPHTESRLLPAAEVEPQVDQALMDAQLGANMLLASETQNPFMDEQYVQGYTAAQQAQAYHQAASSAIAVFFRLRPESAAMFPGIPQQWICPLSSRSIAEIRTAAVQKTPGAVCLGIEGIIKDGKGGELPLPVSDEVELDTYLQHVQGHGAPTFNIHIVPGGPRQWE